MSIPVRRLALAAGVALAVAACSTTNGSPASPSAAADSANAAGGTVRFYNASITATPTPVVAGSSTSFSVTITNCSSAAPCNAAHATTSGQKMQSATVLVPTGFTVTSAFTVTATSGKAWTASLVSGTIRLLRTPGAPADGNSLLPGEWVTVVFTATVPTTCRDYEFTSVGYNSTDFISTDYVRFGSQPSVTVTGCTAAQCHYGFGFWKTHGPVPTGGNTNHWPLAATPMLLGAHSYTALELQSIMNAPVGGNGLISLAHHLIAAKLNIANGADGSSIAQTIIDADAMIGALIVPPVGGGSLSTDAVGELKDALEAFNESNKCSDDIGDQN